VSPEVAGLAEIEVVEEVVGCAAGEDGNLNPGVFAHLLDGIMQSRDGLWDDEISRRIRECDLVNLVCQSLHADRAGLCHLRCVADVGEFWEDGSDRSEVSWLAG
jgi:hypothetical protein